MHGLPWGLEMGLMEQGHGSAVVSGFREENPEHPSQKISKTPK